MLWLFIGLCLWYDGHFVRRALPDAVGNFENQIGAGKLRGLLSALIILSVILMVIGYRSWSASIAYIPPAGFKHLAMLLAWIGFIFVGAGHSKSRVKKYIRHPMLAGFSLWAVSHLLVRGDWASISLFGGLLIWAIISIVIINRQEPSWTPPAGDELSLKGDIRLVAIGTVISTVVILIHIFLFGLIA